MIDYIPILIYFVYLFEIIKSYSIILSVFLFTGLVFIGVLYIFDSLDSYQLEFKKELIKVRKNNSKKFFKRFMIAFVFSFGTYILIPSQKYMYAIIASTGIVEIIKSDTVQRIVPKSVKVIEKYLDEQLKEKGK